VILILGGTTEAYKKAQELDHRNIPFIVTVATDYGFRSFSEYFKEKAVLIDFTQESLTRFIREKGITQVYDCTHPYAFIITERAQKVCNTLGIVYKTFKRDIEST
jgi:precorrin-6A/cobalt-precorrin-6A reductase